MIKLTLDKNHLDKKSIAKLKSKNKIVVYGNRFERWIHVDGVVSGLIEGEMADCEYSLNARTGDSSDWYKDGPDWCYFRVELAEDLLVFSADFPHEKIKFDELACIGIMFNPTQIKETR